MNPTAVKKPNVSEEFATNLVLRLYSLRVTSIKQMVSYDDQNFHIQVSSEHQNPYIDSVETAGYTLKVTNTAKSALPHHFASMHATMIHLHNKGMRVPVPVQNVEGNTWKLEKVPLLNNGTSDGSGELDKCGVHLLTFIAGQPISTITYSPDLLQQWGSLLGQYHNAIEDFDFPQLKSKSIFWNLERVPEIKSFMDGLDSEKTKLVQSVLDEYSQNIEKNLPNLKKGFIHGDFNENNILYQIFENSLKNEKRYAVNGILDFEDIHYGTYAWDVGVMLAYTLLECNSINPLEGAGYALEGYLKYRSLDELELRSLKVSTQMCIACRLCQSLVLGAYSHRLDPSNSYLILSARTGWQRLSQIWRTKNEDLLKLWFGERNRLSYEDIQ